jgi:hypothetical protein
MREGTTSRVMAADRPYGEFYNFTSSVPNILDRPLYVKNIMSRSSVMCCSVCG